MNTFPKQQSGRPFPILPVAALLCAGCAEHRLDNNGARSLDLQMGITALRLIIETLAMFAQVQISHPLDVTVLFLWIRRARMWRAVGIGTSGDRTIGSSE